MQKITNVGAGRAGESTAQILEQGLFERAAGRINTDIESLPKQ